MKALFRLKTLSELLISVKDISEDKLMGVLEGKGVRVFEEKVRAGQEEQSGDCSSPASFLVL